jgi:protoporphyrinogen oxidase
MNTAILGAGLSGLAASYFIGHGNCVVYEKGYRIGGHCKTHSANNSVWDEGPHVSFTKDEFVLDLFKDSVDGEFESLEIKTGNYWKGHWIPHPVQMYLAFVPSPIREECLSGFIAARKANADLSASANYDQWLSNAFGEGIKKHFVEMYTRKYWCQPSKNLATNWIGPRMLLPTVEQLTEGANKQLNKDYHYIQKAIYPTNNGFVSFLRKIEKGANVKFRHEAMRIDLSGRQVLFRGGVAKAYSRLISTIPLNQFVAMIKDVPSDVLDAAKDLSCTSVLLINVVTNKQPIVPYHWLYVYDPGFFSTRISQNHLLSPKNMLDGNFGYQVEVYFLNQINPEVDFVKDKVVDELKKMGLVDEVLEVFTHIVPFANVVPDVTRTQSVEIIFEYLSKFGLVREEGDNHPIHSNHFRDGGLKDAKIILAGRYAQWTYGWTDDCVRRALHIANCIK